MAAVWTMAAERLVPVTPQPLAEETARAELRGWPRLAVRSGVDWTYGP